MSRNIVPRANKDADLGTQQKNWNRLYADAVILRGSDLKALLDSKTDLETLTAKGDLYVATGPGVITRLPVGADGYVLKSNPGATTGLMWGPAGARQELTEDILVTVGSGGQFSTINAALENIVALYYPKYISGGHCPRVTINLLPDFVMAEQVLVESLDLSWITITGDDPETTINRSALAIEFGIGYPAFAAINGGFLPIIGQLFNIDTSSATGNRFGILACFNSRAIVLPYCGVKGAGTINIYAYQNSIINAQGANALNSNSRGIVASYNSIINADNANASGCTNNCIHAIYGSIINAQNANASGAGGNGIEAAHNSIINAFNANATNAGGNGIYAYIGSTINAYSADASGAGENGIYASYGSTINAYAADALNAGTCGIHASYGSTINAESADASGQLGSYSIYIYNGSIINACSATGSLNVTKNTITSKGIIFQ